MTFERTVVGGRLAVGRPEHRVEELLARYGSDDLCPAQLLCDHHPADAVAFTIIAADLTARDLTYGELREKSTRLAGALAELGVAPGDAVGTLMGKSAELVVTLLAIWRCGAIHVPLFTAFAPAAIAMRLTGSGARLVVVDADQRAKLDPSDDVPADPPWLVVTVDDRNRHGDLDFDDLLAGGPAVAMPVRTGPDAPFIMIFTSGTTGSPKGVPVPVRALAHMVAYLEFGYDLTEDDVYWNAADPGWAYGLYYTITGPLAAGRRSILLRTGFSADLSWRVLAEYGVTNFAAAPTVYRALRNSATPARVRLRCASSAGEPLSPDLIPWAEATFGVPIRDHYGQTELGMVVANAWHPDLLAPVRPGSMGKPLPGHNIAVFANDADEPAPAGTLGRVAVDSTAPLFAFAGYHNEKARTAQRFTADGRWYLTGDVARRDDDGCYFFYSRDDDVIIMAGYRIGPFDVESVLATHADVAEAAVIGVPDPLKGEVIEAYVVLRGEATASEALTADLQRHVKAKFAAHAFPRRVHYLDALPKTPSGKIQRFVLRQQRITELADASG